MKTVVAALACIVAISWIYLLAGAGMPKMDMGGGQVMLMPSPSWSISYAAVIFVMWTVMMVAMMLPSAAPTILRIANRAHGLSIAAFFTTGYLIVWTGFSAVATMAQWAFDSAHVLSDSMALRSEVAAGLIVIAAGLYQLSPVKRNCLRRCCSSKNVLGGDRTTSLQWGGPPCPPPLRESMAGTAARPTIKSAAMRQGISYGVSCLGCCWALMCLLFVVGVMNILWIAVIAVWVLAEKTLPWGVRLARVTAVALIGWGSVALATAVL
jgi:predicted metal-binding membrane protein